jgi:uncharacterized protein with PQ loop repeat
VTFSGVVGTIASILGVAFIWPQVYRVYAKQSVEGVSGTSQLIGVTSTLMWLTYGITTDRVPMIVSNASIEVAIIALMVMLVRKKSLPLWQPVLAFAASAVFCVVFAFVSSAVIGVTGVIIGTPAIIPQVWRAIRTKHLFGVSVSTNVLLAAMGTSWFLYGLAIDDPVVSYPNLVLIPSASFIAWRSWSSHRASLSQA